ncbi:hypothetical protein D3C80_1226100 [compost metagenome]
MLEAEHLAGAAETGLDFVEDQHDAMAVAALAQPLQKCLGRGDEAAVPLYGLDENGRDPVGRHVSGEQFVEARQRFITADAAVGVGVGRVVDLGRERPEVLLVGLAHAGKGHAQQGAAMEAAAEGNDRRPVGMATGDLDGVFHRFGTGCEQRGLVVLAVAD